MRRMFFVLSFIVFALFTLSGCHDTLKLNAPLSEFTAASSKCPVGSDPVLTGFQEVTRHRSPEILKRVYKIKCNDIVSIQVEHKVNNSKRD
jgi:hypothetical protein